MLLLRSFFKIFSKFKQSKSSTSYNLNDPIIITQVIRDFGNLMLKKKITSTLFYDTKLLPHPKKVILQCLVLGAEYSQSQSEKENNKTVLLTIVPCFQENVGKIPISISNNQNKFLLFEEKHNSDILLFKKLLNIKPCWLNKNQQMQQK